jgi:hypothetical protein
MIWILRDCLAKKLQKWIDVYIAPMPRFIIDNQFDDDQIRKIKKRLMNRLKKRFASEKQNLMTNE